MILFWSLMCGLVIFDQVEILWFLIVVSMFSIAEIFWHLLIKLLLELLDLLFFLFEQLGSPFLIFARLVDLTLNSCVFVNHWFVLRLQILWVFFREHNRCNSGKFGFKAFYLISEVLEFGHFSDLLRPKSRLGGPTWRQAINLQPEALLLEVLNKTSSCLGPRKNPNICALMVTGDMNIADILDGRLLNWACQLFLERPLVDFLRLFRYWKWILISI